MVWSDWFQNLFRTLLYVVARYQNQLRLRGIFFKLSKVYISMIEVIFLKKVFLHGLEITPKLFYL